MDNNQEVWRSPPVFWHLVQFESLVLLIFAQQKRNDDPIDYNAHGWVKVHYYPQKHQELRLSWQS